MLSIRCFLKKLQTGRSSSKYFELEIFQFQNDLCTFVYQSSTVVKLNQLTGKFCIV